MKMRAVLTKAIRFDRSERCNGSVEQVGVLAKDRSAQIEVYMAGMGLDRERVSLAIGPLELDRTDLARSRHEHETSCQSMSD